jgi:hypothetical protein
MEWLGAALAVIALAVAGLAMAALYLGAVLSRVAEALEALRRAPAMRGETVPPREPLRPFARSAPGDR